MSGESNSGREPAMLVLAEDQGVRRWYLVEESVTIGRDRSCGVVLDDRRVSRLHAEIRREGGRYVLVDNGSKNGTYLNGDRVTEPVAIKDGDMVQIALASSLLFVAQGATAPLGAYGVEEPGLRVNRDGREVWIEGKLVDPPLSAPQFRLLDLLWSKAGNVVARDEVVTTVWPDESVDGVSEQAIDALVRRLRERLSPSARFRVVTVRGHGFKLEVG